MFRDDINEVWNSPDYQKIPKQFIDGERPETCRCFREEDAGVRPIGYNEKWWKDDVQVAEEIPLDIRYVDIRLGNLCNLKCRMCNPIIDMWVKDWNSIVDTAELAPNEPPDEDKDWMKVLGEWPDRKQTGVNFVEIAHLKLKRFI